MKVALLGESISMPTGFGTQMKAIVDGLVAGGHECVIITNTRTAEDCPDGVTEMPTSTLSDLEAIDKKLHSIKPDAVVGFWASTMESAWSMLRSPGPNCPMFMWLPWESSTLPKKPATMFARMQKNSIVHMTHFAKDLWGESIESNNMIYHGVDLDVFGFSSMANRQPEARKQKVRALANKLRQPIFEDDLILFCGERNITHKRWDATFDYVKKLSGACDRQVRLLVNSHKVPMNDNWKGWDLEELARMYEVEENVVFTDFSWAESFTREELAEIYQFVDFRISTSSGEGFGLHNIECMSCGCPQIVNKHTTAGELFGDSPFVVESSMTEYARDGLWALPDVNAMVDRTLDLMEPSSYELLDSHTLELRQRAEKLFDIKEIGKKWCGLLEAAVEANTPIEGKNKAWHTHRHGFKSSVVKTYELRDLVLACMDISRDMTILDVNGFKGEFIGYCQQGGITAKLATLSDIDFADLPAAVKQDALKPSADLPNVNTLVFTDSLGQISKEQAPKYAELLQTVDWVFAQDGPTWRWDEDLTVHEFSWESYGLRRREDIEAVAKDRHKNFNHKVYTRVDGIPEGLR